MFRYFNKSGHKLEVTQVKIELLIAVTLLINLTYS